MSDPLAPSPLAAPGTVPAPLTDQDVLDRIHRLTLGNPDVPIPRKQFATLLGLPLRETGVVLQRLARQGLITFVPWRSFRLTAAGAAATPKPLPTLRDIRRS
ncbi:MAG: hypothetical protein IPK12_01355 [Gemmatimonadetes bacterium]|nr:hypothetical protein [Gemmatimonadota bacterium]